MCGKETGPILEMKEIVKDFPGVRALDRVSFTLERGEIHALVGANGAGKSTLIKVLGGVYKEYGGEVLVEGKPHKIVSPRRAMALGIAVIHQEFNLVPALSVGENIMLGREPRRRNRWGWNFPFLDRARLYTEAEELLAELNFPLPSRAKVSELGVAAQQMVQIAKAMAAKARILVMDEPTARLSSSERDELFEIMKRLKANGTAIVYISHFLEEVFMVADRVTVLRDGRVVGSAPARDLTQKELIRLMLGQEVTPTVREERRFGPVALRVEGLSVPGRFTGIDLTVQSGEILGLAGLVGSGRTELARAIFGCKEARMEGKIAIEDRPCRFRSPREAITRGLALLPEDRKGQGLVLVRPVAENILLAVGDRLRRGPFLAHGARRTLVHEMLGRLRIKCTSPLMPVETLSGGNQQKVVLAKWLAAHPRILILDQPTAGIDVGTKEEIYAFLHELAADGAALILISDDPEELARVCDRVLVMRKGRIVRELTGRPSSVEILASVTAEY